MVGAGLGNPPDQFSAYGGPGDLRQRAAMVDEFLDLLTRLWTGDPVDFGGAYYTATGVALRPTPLQRPRIPIWIGADSTHRAPRRRAARWDGFVPASESWPEGVISAREYVGMAADIAAQRSVDQPPVDLVVLGDAAGTRPTPAELEDYAAAGVTWVLVQALTVDDARRRVTEHPTGGRDPRGSERANKATGH